MSIKLINQVFNSSYAKDTSGRGSSHSAKLLVMICLARYASDDGSNCRPSQGTVAKECGISREVVNRKISELCQDGFLSFLSQPGQPFSCQLHFDQLPTCDSKRPTCDSESQLITATCDLESQQPVILNDQPVILNDQPVILNDQPVILNHIIRYDSLRSVNNPSVENSKSQLATNSNSAEEIGSDSKVSLDGLTLDDFADKLITFRRRLLRVNILRNESLEFDAVKWMYDNGFTADESISCYNALTTQKWRDVPVTWSVVSQNIADWRNKPQQKPAETNYTDPSAPNWRNPITGKGFV